MKKIMTMLLAGCILAGTVACVPNTPVNPVVPPSPDVGDNGGGEEPVTPPFEDPTEEETIKLREERNFTDHKTPSNLLNEEELPDAKDGAVSKVDGDYVLSSGGLKLKLAQNAGKYALSVTSGLGIVCAEQTAPAKLYVRGQGAIETGYTSVSEERYGLKASVTVQSENGSEFLIEDLYYVPQKGDGAFNVRRSITVTAANSSDRGFESIFRVSVPSGGADDYSWFVPNNIFGEFPDATSKIYRETLLGLPFAMFRSNTSGYAISLGRYQPIITPTDNSFASIALINEGDAPCMEVAYPARDSARRYFDVEEDSRIVYDLTVRAEHTQSFAGATSSVYNAHFDLQDQRIVDTDIDEVYRVINEDFKTFLHSESQYNSALGSYTSYGLPWRITLENGTIGPYTYQAGFVGQQIPAAYNMLHYGVREDDAQSFRNGMNTVDFWVKVMMTESGVPKIWYDTWADGFRSYPTFLRMAVDAMEGVFDAYRLVSEHGISRPEWLNALVSFADFLVNAQNADGSWYRCYNWNGTMFVNGDNGIPEPGGNICQSSSKANTTMPVRFLGKMYELTGETKYKTAAIDGGEYVYRVLYPVGYYTGGTCDNPNAVDKEAGVYAMYCYDTMYMLTKDSKWIECLKQATAFTMSAVVAYSFEINQNSSDLKAAYALKYGYTDGLSFICCGSTGVDNYIAYIYYELFRIYIITGEKTYFDQAEFVQQNSKSTMDWDGKLNYPYKSLVAEATTIYSFGFSSATDDNGVMGVWLPWASVANAEPIAKMYDHFGTADVKDLEDYPLETLRESLEQYGIGGKKHRKYLAACIRNYT